MSRTKLTTAKPKSEANEENSLGLRYSWATILDLEEIDGIDFFRAVSDMTELGITGLVTILHRGMIEDTPNITRPEVVDILRQRKGPFQDELKAIFDEISEAIKPSDDEEDDESTA